VNQRWVCKRCFADNDDTAIACTKCGLTRGSEAPPADQAQWAQAAAPVPPPKEGWTKWLKFAWIPIVVVVLAVGYFLSARRDSSGQIESGGTLSVQDLQVGDCFDVADEEEFISDVDAVPCGDPHDYEVYHVQDYETAAFPTDTELQAITDEICIGTFQTYVGVAYVDSELYALPITPSEESFGEGDREYICVLYEPDVELTGSMAGANR
jgi:hypothetical protein